MSETKVHGPGQLFFISQSIYMVPFVVSVNYLQPKIYKLRQPAIAPLDKYNRDVNNNSASLLFI